jgi:hypothetical protein
MIGKFIPVQDMAPQTDFLLLALTLFLANMLSRFIGWLAFAPCALSNRVVQDQSECEETSGRQPSSQDRAFKIYAIWKCRCDDTS